MSFFYLLALALLLSFCIKAQAGQSCSSLFSPDSSWLSGEAPFNVTLEEDHPRKLTLFKQSSLSLPTDQSLSFTFTITNSCDEDEAPSLAFILASPSSMRSMELRLTAGNKEPSDCPPPKSLDVCNPRLQTLQIQLLAANCHSEQDPADHSDKTVVSLRYYADEALLLVQASHGLKINQTFNFNTSDSLPDIATTLFVGYITSENATINIVEVVYDHNAKSNHKKVVVWVIVGVSMVVFLLGLLILVLFITKRRRRPSLVRSHPAGHGAPPSAPPFSHHDLESSETPMMKAKVPLSPPHTSAFQISGTPSWLKQPNPR